MKLLMIHNDYARPSGEEHAAEAIAELLRANGHEVRWFRKSSADIVGSAVRTAGAFFSGVYSRRARREVSELVREESFDIAQVQNLYPLLSPSILRPLAQAGIPVVMRCPNYRLFCPNGLHLRRGRVCERCLGVGRELWCLLGNCENNLLKSAAYALRGSVARRSGMITDNVSIFLVQSAFQRDRFVAAGIEADRIVIVPGAAPPEYLATQEAPPGQTIGFVGRVGTEKGVEDFFSAARAMPNRQFAVAADVTGFDRLVESAPANVEFRGFLSGDALVRFYRDLRVLVCPSRCFEGFPNVVARAMAVGKPVIASEIGVLPEIVADGRTGLLFPPGDVEALADRIDRLAGDDDLCRHMGQAGRAKAAALYTPEVVYERLIEAYQKAVRFAGR